MLRSAQLSSDSGVQRTAAKLDTLAIRGKTVEIVALNTKGCREWETREFGIKVDRIAVILKSLGADVYFSNLGARSDTSHAQGLLRYSDPSDSLAAVQIRGVIADIERVEIEQQHPLWLFNHLMDEGIEIESPFPAGHLEMRLPCRDKSESNWRSWIRP